MSSHTPYAVPKDRQAVTLHFGNGTTLQGSIFLEYGATEMTIHQKVSAFLENRDFFFPLLLNESGKTEFISKKKVRIVEVEYRDGEENNVTLRLMRSINVIVVFTDGITLSGDLMAEVPEQKARLLDCLNLPNSFLSMKAGGKIFYINRDAVQKVVHAA